MGYTALSRARATPAKMALSYIALPRMPSVSGTTCGLLAAGLGARDTLRLEASMCLYDHELTEQINPLEARLGWTIKFDKGDFIGRAALLKVKEEGLKRKLVGIELLERGVPRGGYTIYENDQPIGVLTSGV